MTPTAPTRRRVLGRDRGRRGPSHARVRRGVTMVEMLVAVAILALLAAMWMSSDNPETANDRQRYDDAADVLYRLTQAIVGNNPTRGQTSFKWVITVYP